MRTVSAAVLVASLVACTTAHNRVHERQVYWQEVMHSEVPVGSTRDALLAWANGRSIRLSDPDAAGRVYAGVEYIETHEWVCRGWSVTLEFILSSDGSVAKETVRTLGNCV
jgi:hypothetical protein